MFMLEEKKRQRDTVQRKIKTVNEEYRHEKNSKREKRQKYKERGPRHTRQFRTYNIDMKRSSNNI